LVGRRAWTAGLAIACLCAVASAAQAAELKIGVPGHIRKSGVYTITLTGSYRRSEVHGTPFLIAAIQFGGQPCQRTAQAENNLSHRPQFYLASDAGVYESRSPFTRADTLRAKSSGSRRICAWLYPEFSGPTDTARPIATADAPYRVARRH
jgi:hypothetical protein